MKVGEIMFNKRDLNLLMDFYELTMANAYFNDGKHEEEAVFDYFFRRVPDEGGYAIFAGLEQIIDYLSNLEFDDQAIKYLESTNTFSEGFLNYLKDFKFRCSVYAFEEGMPVFPNEPIIVVKGPIIQCQLIETMLLLTANHQSLIATKTSRIVKQANGGVVLEFGSRRAHGYDAAIFGARAAYIGGVVGTSNTLADYMFGIPALGTMAHSYVQSFPTEFEAFKAYSLNYPDNAVLLVDTYDTLNEGIPNAIKVNNEVLKPLGKRVKGIRIDSGDLAYLTKQARKLLDDAGMTDCKITVSNSLDEYLIRDLISNQGAQIDSFGVGERLITARSEAVFGGVYKLSAVIKDDEVIPKIKLSNNPEKTTTPGFKQVYRFYDNKHMAIADVITVHDEIIDHSKPYLLFDPIYPYKQQLVSNFNAVPMLKEIFNKGKLVYQKPSLDEIRSLRARELKALWPEVKRIVNPHKYYIDLSEKLWDLKQRMIDDILERVENVSE